jgi:hypothetical protein
VIAVEDLAVYGVVDAVEPEAPSTVPDPLSGAPRPSPPGPSSPASFFRLLPASPVGVAAWWTRRSCDGEVCVEHRLRVGPLHDDGAGAWSATGWLRRPVTHRWMPVELVLWPHLGATKLTLDPRRRVRSTSGWFRSGHRALDTLAREVALAG